MTSPESTQGDDIIKVLDATGYRCPMPVIRMEAALRSLLPGQKIIIRADDPLAVVDIPHFCNESNHLAEKLPDEGSPEKPVCVFLVTCGANQA